MTPPGMKYDKQGRITYGPSSSAATTPRRRSSTFSAFDPRNLVRRGTQLQAAGAAGRAFGAGLEGHDIKAQNDFWTDLLNQTPRGPGGGGGGGGGGGAAPPPDLSRMAGGLQQILQSNQWTAKDDPRLAGLLDRAVRDDRATVTQQYDGLDSWLAKNNPKAFEQLQLQRTQQIDPDMAALLQSQGVDPAAYTAEVGMANRLASQSDTAAENLRRTLAANELAGHESRKAESQQGRTFADREVSAAKKGFEAALAAKTASRQEGLDQQRMQLLIQLVSLMGQDPKLNLDLKGLI
jgi:hypothetical protein